MSYLVTPEMRAVLQKDIDEGILSEPGQAVVWMLLKGHEHCIRALREIENCDGPGARKVARAALEMVCPEDDPVEVAERNLRIQGIAT